MAWEFAPFACYWWSFAVFYLCRGGLVGPCPPAHAGTVCFDLDLGYFRRGGGAARVSGLVELLSLLLGCLGPLGTPPPPGAWPVGLGVEPSAVSPRTVGRLLGAERSFGSDVIALNG